MIIQSWITLWSLSSGQRQLVLIEERMLSDAQDFIVVKASEIWGSGCPTMNYTHQIPEAIQSPGLTVSRISLEPYGAYAGFGALIPANELVLSSHSKGIKHSSSTRVPVDTPLHAKVRSIVMS